MEQFCLILGAVVLLLICAVVLMIVAVVILVNVTDWVQTIFEFIRKSIGGVFLKFHEVKTNSIGDAGFFFGVNAYYKGNFIFGGCSGNYHILHCECFDEVNVLLIEANQKLIDEHGPKISKVKTKIKKTKDGYTIKTFYNGNICYYELEIAEDKLEEAKVRSSNSVHVIKTHRRRNVPN